MAFKDKNQFGTGNREDEFRTGAFPLKSADEESFAEESPNEEEEELSEEELAEEMKPFTLADWKQSIPDYTAEELEGKLPERGSRWALVISCLWGTFLGAAIAGLLVNHQPRPQQLRAFFIFFLVLAPLLSCIEYWFFILRPENIRKKLRDEQANAVGSEPIQPNEEWQQAQPAASEPIHPK